MKELSIEQKTQRYDEAFRIAQELYNNPYSSNIGKGYVCTIFPKLKEDKDKKIREELIKHLKEGAEGYEPAGGTEDYVRWLSWLEKQGEQKSDKIEPKFKQGDWVVKGNIIAQILDIQEQYYVGLDINGKDFTSSRFLSVDKIHLWTIQDAKDGDVFVMQRTNVTYETIFIFNKIENNRIIPHLYYFTTDTGEEVCNAGSINGFLGFIVAPVHPATKEQRDVLIKAMADTGYTFDFDKKELKKVEPKFNAGDTMRTLQEAKDGYVDGMPVVISIDDKYYHCTSELIAIKDQDDYEFPPMNRRQKPAWSEEDENRINRLIAYFEYKESFSAEDDIVYANWLKSIKQRIEWKPSEGQMKALAEALSLVKNWGEESAFDLRTLYEQLKNL